MKDHELKLALKVNSARPPLTAEDLLKKKEDDAKRKTLNAKIMKLFQVMVVMRKQGWRFDEHGADTMEPWLKEAISDYYTKQASR